MQKIPPVIHPDPLALLKDITASREKREKRGTEILREPSAEGEHGWHMCVPRYFNDALDIRQTDRIIDKLPRLIWTQGGEFSFSKGDVIYDTVREGKPKLAIQIKKSLPAGYSLEGDRIPGELSVEIYSPGENGFGTPNTAKLTQDQFVEFLIAGPEGDDHPLAKLQT